MSNEQWTVGDLVVSIPLIKEEANHDARTTGNNYR